MRLTQLIVQNYRMVDTLRLTELKGLNVFIGPNATGKSTMLQAAASLLQAPQLSVTADDVFRPHAGNDIIIEGTVSFDDRDFQAIGERAAIRGGLPDPPESVAGWMSQLFEGKVEAMFRVRPTRRRETATSSPKRLISQSRDLRSHLAPNISKDHPWIAGSGVSRGQLADHLHAASEEIIRMKSMFLPTGRNTPVRFEGHRVEEISAQDAGPWMLQAKVEDWDELPQYEDELRTFLPHLQSLRTTSVSRQGGQFELGAIEGRLPGTTPANQWSSGTMHLALTLLGLVGLPRGSVMLIEEPELSLHPYAIRRLMEKVTAVVDEGRIQVFLTTHSPLVAMGIHPDEADHSLWHFSRKEDGSADAISCSTEAEVVKAMDSLLEPQE